MRRLATFAALAVCAASAAFTSPGFHGFAHDAYARLSTAFAWWSSIMLAAMPYVTMGALLAALFERMPHRYRAVGALAFVAAPGCDCSASGYASALRDEPPALAGFALAWSAAAGPAALLATNAVLGRRVLVARLVGAAVTSTLTALSWRIGARTTSRASRTADRRAAHLHASTVASLCSTVAPAIVSLSICAFVATTALVFARGTIDALASPLPAALAGALLSPCSTSDAVLARVIAKHASAQAAFVIAAQTLDVRQLATIVRVFGARRAMLAGLAGIAGCAAASVFAR